MNTEKLGDKIVADIINTQKKLTAIWTDGHKVAVVNAAKLLASAYEKQLSDEDPKPDAEAAAALLKDVPGLGKASSLVYITTSLLRMAYADASVFMVRKA